MKIPTCPECKRKRNVTKSDIPKVKGRIVTIVTAWLCENCALLFLGEA